jgi:hypothetical protein
MARKLNDEEIAAAKVEHIRLLDEIDRQVDAKKDTVKSCNEIIKELRTKEADVRIMVKTGEGIPEQLVLLPITGDE